MIGCIVVTGAAGIVGRAVTAYLSDRNIEVVGIDLAHGPSNGSRFLGGIDLTSADSVEQAIDLVPGPIYGLANIAGGFRWETIGEGDPRTWEEMFRINVLTALNVSRAVLPRLMNGGAIVNVGAAATVKAGAGMGAYTASKSAVARMTEALAEEVKARGIRVNAVLPTIVDTPANRAEMGDVDADRWVRPEELAAVIAFLLSPEASAVSGISLPVNGRL